MRYEFAGFTLDDERFELRFDGAVVPVQRRVFDTIAFLIAHRDRVVTKDELVAGPWQGVTVSDAALDRAIMLARRALEPADGGREMIRTVRGRGYVWISPVRTVDNAARLRELTAKMGSSAPDSPLFVGRELELESLRGWFRAATNGRGGIVLVEGAPGVGKTRLVEQFTQSSLDAQAEPLWGNCWEGGGAPPLWPWIQVIRSYLDRHVREGLSIAHGPIIDTLATLLPELRPGAEQRVPDAEMPQTRFRVFDALAQFFRAATQHRPLVVVLEDIHAADDSSLLLLSFLARCIGEMRLLALATYRAPQFPENPALSSLASNTSRHTYKITLGGLGEAELRQLLQEIIEDPPPAFVTALHRTTEGNPFLSEQFARLALAGQPNRSRASAATLEHFRMPDRIADAIRHHLTSLSPAACELLELASVVGRHFDLTLLAQASSSQPTAASQLLDEALRTGLVHEQEGVGRYAFSHALVRETIYRDLPPGRRGELHRKVAEGLERLYQGAEDLVLPQLAHHFLHAAHDGDPERCIAYATRAAESALHISAYELAAEYYATALNALALQDPDPQRRCRLLLKLADAQRLSGRHEEAVATYDQVADIGRSLRMPVLVAEAALGLSETRREGLMIDPMMAARLDEALRSLEPSDSALRAKLLAYSAVASYHVLPLSERLRLSAEALEVARRIGDRSSLVVALSARHWTVYQTTYDACALDLIDEMIELAKEMRDPEKTLDAKLWRIADLLGAGSSAALKSELSEYASLAQQYAHPFHLCWTSLIRTNESALRAEFAKAGRLAEESRDLGLPLHNIIALGLFTTQSFTTAIETDGGARVEPMVQNALLHMPMFTPWRTAVALIYALTHRYAEAAKELQCLSADDFGAISEDAHTMGSLGNLARVAAALGDTEAARSLYRRLAAYRGRNIVIGTGAACWGPVNYYLGLLASCYGDRAEARAHFEAARQEVVPIGAFAVGAWVDFYYGRLLAAESNDADRKLGAALIDKAMSFALDTGMRVLALQIGAARA